MLNPFYIIYFWLTWLGNKSANFSRHRADIPQGNNIHFASAWQVDVHMHVFMGWGPVHVWIRVYANAYLQVRHKTRAKPVFEGRICNWGQTTCFSALCSPVKSHLFFFFPPVISPAKCLSLKPPDNAGHNPDPLRFPFPLSSEDKM